MEGSSRDSVVGPELFFLISKFLSLSPLEETKKVLIAELERHKILPKRIDWLGQEHEQSFEELERKYPHIGPKHLLEICSRIGPILDRELKPSVQNVPSLLGAGRQSLLRSKDTIITHSGLVDHCTRLKGMPLPESSARRKENNLSRVLFGREHGGPIVRRQAVSCCFYEKLSLLRRTLGHLSAVYCVLFERSGKYILTGADDFLVKLWSAIDGRLLATFRGATSEITDIAVNIDNTLMAAGSLDRMLRVWDLQTTAPIAVLMSHTGMITSVNFCPSPRGVLKYLVTTSTDGSVAFWQYSVHRGKTQFNNKPIQYHEKLRPGQAQMICAAFSPGGIFLAAGSADHFVRVYLIGNDGPKRILETEAHTDTVDSIQWAHQGLRFISGGKDGTAHIWHFEAQQWRSMRLSMNARLPGSGSSDDDSKKLKVTMVSWDASDNWVMTAVNDFTIKVWNSQTGQLHKVLQGHTDELYVLESHPMDPHVLLSAGHDGQIYLWDIFTGRTINNFVNYIEGQGNGGVFDAKWSPDGTMIAATDSHGHILMFGFGSGHARLKQLPTELFFHTDYRPLTRDSDFHVLDEQTEQMPHLMPPPFLVDVDGNPHPPELQRLVPGREHCPTDQLIPNIGPGNEGVMEVQSENNTVSDLDLLIEALANRQGANNNNNRGNDDNQAQEANNQEQQQAPQQPAAAQQLNRLNSLNSPRGSVNRVGLRRSGDVEGVRQSSGNWHRGDASFKFKSRCFVQPIRYPRLQTLKYSVYCTGHLEMEIYKREMRRRPVMINTNSQPSPGQGGSGGQAIGRTRNRNVRQQPPPSNSNYRTRSIRLMEAIESEEEEEEEHDDSNSGSSSDMSERMAELEGSSSSDSDSSEYSDWVADQEGPNLEPPKRSNRTRVERRAFSPSDSNRSRYPGRSVEADLEEGGPLRSAIVASAGARRAAAAAGQPEPPGDGTGLEVPPNIRPSRWLAEVIPHKAPYYPQMGDEVVYLRQGHQRYLEAVRSKNVYALAANAEPWQKVTLRDHEFVKVIGIKYELRPPRLCCLKLALLDPDGGLTGRTFTIKYHDMPDVLDFLVLRQTYNTAVSRNWQPGDRFRCMIDDAWWLGVIESRMALSPEFAQSLFMCFHVRWDNGEFEYMSPWDMEPVDENRLPSEEGEAVPVLPEELQSLLYQPKPEEWLDGDREEVCRRICAGLDQVMQLPFCEPFSTPVDLSLYPSYAYVVEYPIDMSMIKARFENHFYRRITSAQFDVRYLARNAEKYNEAHSEIVKQSRVLVELCLRVIRETREVDWNEAFHDIYHAYQSSDEEQAGQPSSSGAGPTTSRGLNGARRSQRLGAPIDWKQECRELLELLWQCDDSSPFREPVDVIEHPDYHQIIDTPMDLLTIKEDLLGGNYANPEDFAKDVRLIFTNSKNYNTNKRSRIYSMTLRLSTLFETHIRPIVNDWKSSKRTKSRRGGGSSHAEQNNDDPNEPGPSRRVRRSATNGGGTRRVLSSSDEYSDDDATNTRSRPTTSSTSTRNGTRAVASSSSMQNGVSSSSMAGPSSSYNSRRDPLEGPSSTNSRPTRSARGGGGNADTVNGHRENGRSLRRRVEPDQNEEEELEHDSEDSSNSSSDSGDSDESNEIPLAELGGGARRTHRQDDSEDSYRPSETTSQRAAKKKKKKESGSARRSSKRQASSQPMARENQSRSTRRRRRLVSEEDDLHSSRNDEADEHPEQATDSDSEFLLPRKRARTNRAIVPPGQAAASSSSSRDHVRRGRNNGTRESTAAAVAEAESDEEGDVASSDEDLFDRRRRKRGRYESDQSFQLEEPVRSTRRGRFVGSESGEDEVVRPTRGRRRVCGRRVVNGDDEGHEEEEEEQEADEPRPQRRAAAAAVAEASSSQRRSNRTRVARVHNSDYVDDDDDEEEEEVMPQRSQRSQNTRGAIAAAAVTSGRFRTRRQAMFDEEDEPEPEPDQPSQRTRRRQLIAEETEEEEEEDEDEAPQEEEYDDDDSEEAEEPEENDDGSESDRPRRRRTTQRSQSSQNSLLNNSSRNSKSTRSGRLNNHENGRQNGSREGEEEEPLAGPSTAVTGTTTSSRSARLERRLMNEVSSSQNSNSSSVRLLAHEVDHNYLQPDRLRNTRRTLSRHQRNADELDPLQGVPSTSSAAAAAGPADVPAAPTSRFRSAAAAAAPATSEPTIMQRRNYLSRTMQSVELSQPVVVLRADVVTVNGSSPRLSRLSQSRIAEPGPSTSHRDRNGSTQRTSGRAVKRRMDYNEESEEDDRTTRRSRATLETSYNEQRDEEEVDGDEDTGGYEEENGEPTVSVSSRGRVRKIIAKARRIFRE